jgi:hypothetical protein
VLANAEPQAHARELRTVDLEAGRRGERFGSAAREELRREPARLLDDAANGGELFGV